LITIPILCLACFLCGIGVRHAYRDDPALDTFADALLTVVTVPVAYARTTWEKSQRVPPKTVPSLPAPRAGK
jgi:hypothetical protein